MVAALDVEVEGIGTRGGAYELYLRRVGEELDSIDSTDQSGFELGFVAAQNTILSISRAN